VVPRRKLHLQEYSADIPRVWFNFDKAFRRNGGVVLSHKNLLAYHPMLFDDLVKVFFFPVGSPSTHFMVISPGRNCIRIIEGAHYAP